MKSKEENQPVHMSSSKSQSQSNKPSVYYGSPCAACKFLRRKCLPDCIFAPHFPADQPQKFELVHRIFGASNVSKILSQLSYDVRNEAVDSLVYEAEAWLHEPVYGCVRFMSILQKRLEDLQNEFYAARSELSTYMASETQAAHCQIPQPLHQPRVGSLSSSSMIGTPRARSGPSLSEQLLMRCPQRVIVDGQDGQSSSQRGADRLLERPLFGTSYAFHTNDGIQPYLVDQMSDVLIHPQQLQRSFGSQQPATADQKPPATIWPPPQPPH